VINDKGQLIEHYHKMHLFDVEVEDEHKNYRESDLFKHGSQAKQLETPVGRIGLSICYDLRFPNLYNLLRNAGAEVLIVPAAFTAVTGQAHWEILLRARAIENQAWVVGVGQCGYHSSERQTWGHSMVVDPWGNIVSQAAMVPCTITADIDLEKMKQVRQSMPVASHQKINSLINNNE
jgi:predicted amidohydrolase